MKAIFYNSVGDFQWASVTAIVAFSAFIASSVSIIVTISISKKNRQANFIHKNRTKWIEEIRDLTAELEMNFFALKSERYGVSKGMKTKSDKEIEKLINQILVAAAKLKMYFISDDERDKEIKEVIEYEERKATSGNVKDEAFFDPYLSTNIAIYIQEEWLDTQKKIS